jgi:hypothetical protein
MRIVIVQLGVWLRHLPIVISTIVSNLMEYCGMAAPIYASWGFDTDIYYEKISIMNS